VTLYKWQVTIASPVSKVDLQPQPTLAHCVASILASTLSRSGCSKSIILPIGATPSTLSQSGQPLLHIWLFNGNISFTSSVVESEGPVPAVKVLYRFVTKAEADRLSDSIMSDAQEITLPTQAVQGLRLLLERSNRWLPSGDRIFKEWTVGLLGKWS
jgi:ubiquitin-protein ligase E3 D